MKQTMNIKTKKPRKPFTQGAIDNFCGPYAILNAMQLLTGPFSNEKASKEMEIILTYLDGYFPIIDVFSYGIGLREMTGVLKRYAKRTNTFSFTLPFYRQSSRPFKAILIDMRLHLAKPNTTIIIGYQVIGRASGHWSVVYRISNKRLILFDSRKHQFLNIDDIFTPKERKKRIEVRPSEIIFISLNST